MKSQKSVVTGASGFVGAQLCKSLLEQGSAVLAVHRNPLPEWLSNGRVSGHLQTFACDLSDDRALEQIFREFQPEIVFHTAAHIPSNRTGEERKSFASNVIGTMNVLEAMKLSGGRKIVYSSTGSVYGTPPSYPARESHATAPVDFYSFTKLEGERFCENYCKNYGFQAVSLRYGGIYGQHRESGVIAGWIQRALRGEEIVISSPASTKDIVHIDDVVQSNILAAELKPDSLIEIINISGGEEVSLLQIANCIIESTSSVSRCRKNADQETRISFDVVHARERLGFHPMSYQQGIASTVKWFMALNSKS